MMNATATGDAPLAGLRVIELGSMYASPTAGRMLRDFGADVAKVEEPITGDVARQWEPIREGLSMGFARLNSGKRSVGIDLRKPEGRDLVRALAQTADVVIESFRPGRMEAWGMSYDVLSRENRGLVMTRVSGFGQFGPYRDRPGFGTVAETLSGYAFLNGWQEMPPTSPPFGLADSIAGISAAFGTMMAIYGRSTTGVGAEVDVALYEPLLFILGDSLINFTSTGEVAERRGNASLAASPRGIYRAADGRWLSIAASSQTVAMRLFSAMGREDLKRSELYATNFARMRNDSLLQEIIGEWVSSGTRDKILSVLLRHDVVAAAVNDSSDIVHDPHFLERSLVALSQTPLGDDVLTPGPILHVSGYQRPEYVGVPGIGEHTAELLSPMDGFSQARLADLASRGIVSPV